MSQNPIIDSSAQSSKSSGLKPVLATALASLEVQLDQELTRYRRTLSKFRQPKQVGSESYISSQSPQSNGLTATPEKTQSSAASVNTNPSRQENQSLGIDKQEEINHFQVSASQEGSKTQTPLDPKSSSSIVPTKVQATETLLQADDTSIQPDDYLESSEALLRSLTQEQPQTQKSNNSSTSDSLLSPLSIGSMLLLLLASLTLGYVVLNPRTLPQFNLGKLFNVNPSQNKVDTQITENNPPPTAVAEITPLPKYPNLAAREFPEVRDPNDVVGLKPKVQPTPTPIRKPVAVQTLIKPVVPIPPVPPITPTPKPQSTAALPTLNEEIKPSADGFYYVVTDNQGNGALAAARQVVPDAYLSPNRKYIYLGALKTKEETKLKLQQLQAKGIKASVQK